MFGQNFDQAFLIKLEGRLNKNHVNLCSTLSYLTSRPCGPQLLLACRAFSFASSFAKSLAFWFAGVFRLSGLTERSRNGKVHDTAANHSTRSYNNSNSLQ